LARFIHFVGRFLNFPLSVLNTETCYFWVESNYLGEVT
jgi:hypothetical protein